MALGHHVRRVSGFLGLALSGLALQAAAQQDFPVKPIRLIVPSGAGGGTAGLTMNMSVKTPPLGGKGLLSAGLGGAVQPTAGQQLGRYGDILKELWGPGGPLNNIALAQAQRADVPATAPGGLLLQHLRDLACELSAIFLSPYACHEHAMSTP